MSRRLAASAPWVLLSLRLVYLAVLRVFGWLTLPPRVPYLAGIPLERLTAGDVQAKIALRTSGTWSVTVPGSSPRRSTQS